jgi:hypothetical protein
VGLSGPFILLLVKAKSGLIHSSSCLLRCSCVSISPTLDLVFDLYGMVIQNIQELLSQTLDVPSDVSNAKPQTQLLDNRHLQMMLTEATRLPRRHISNHRLV